MYYVGMSSGSGSLGKVLVKMWYKLPQNSGQWHKIPLPHFRRNKPSLGRWLTREKCFIWCQFQEDILVKMPKFETCRYFNVFVNCEKSLGVFPAIARSACKDFSEVLIPCYTGYTKLNLGNIPAKAGNTPIFIILILYQYFSPAGVQTQVFIGQKQLP